MLTPQVSTVIALPLGSEHLIFDILALQHSWALLGPMLGVMIGSALCGFLLIIGGWIVDFQEPLQQQQFMLNLRFQALLQNRNVVHMCTTFCTWESN